MFPVQCVLIEMISFHFADHSNDLVAGSFGMCQRQLGSTLDCGAIIRDAQLGNGI